MKTLLSASLRQRLAAASLTAAAVSVTAFALPAFAAPSATGAITGNGGKCVDVDNAGTANGTAIQIYDCNNSNAQRWTFAADGSIRALGKCLDVSGGGTTNGTPVQLWDCNGSKAQQWIYTSGKDLVNPQANKCLDISGGGSTSGTRLQLWDCVGVVQQKWSPPAHQVTHKRVVVYYQTQYNGTQYVSPLAMTTNNTRVSDVIVGAFHLNSNLIVHLNDHPPSHSRYTQMWSELATMQGRGVRVLGMIGGAAQGSFQRLDTQFDTYYPLLKNIITTYRLDGVDLDVEEYMSLAGIERVIRRLRADFGPDFVITLAPVATALYGGGNLSGFNYDQLYRNAGADIAWFNAQFYNGWGYMGNTTNYNAIATRGVIPVQKVVAGTLSNPGNGGSGFVDINTVKSTVQSLISQRQEFGGVAGWEYFNSLPGGTAAPWQWANEMATAQGR